MTTPFIDTDVIVRLVTGDDKTKQVAALALFDEVAAGRLEVAAPDAVIADTVYVLGSPAIYNLPRPDIRALLAPIWRCRIFVSPIAGFCSGLSTSTQPREWISATR